MPDTVIVHITCPNLNEASQIARALVEKRLAACATVGTHTSSIYHWEGRMEETTEYPLTAKTRAGLFEALAAEVRRLHSHKVPQILAVPVVAGDASYLDWVDASTPDQPLKNHEA